MAFSYFAYHHINLGFFIKIMSCYVIARWLRRVYNNNNRVENYEGFCRLKLTFRIINFTNLNFINEKLSSLFHFYFNKTSRGWKRKIHSRNIHGSVIEIKRKRRVTELIKNLNIVAIGKWYLSPYDPPLADNNESDMIMWRMQRKENKKE